MSVCLIVRQVFPHNGKRKSKSSSTTILSHRLDRNATTGIFSYQTTYLLQLKGSHTPYRYSPLTVNVHSNYGLCTCSILRSGHQPAPLCLTYLVVWVQQSTVLICTFCRLSGFFWHSHQTFFPLVPQARRAEIQESNQIKNQDAAMVNSSSLRWKV